MGIDRVITKYAYHKPIMARFSDKYEWQNGFKPNIIRGLVWYPNMSKAKKALVLGRLNWAREGHISSLRPHATVFQAEICAINVYVLWNIERARHIRQASNLEDQPTYLAVFPPTAK
jgi:hypothetical protein